MPAELAIIIPVYNEAEAIESNFSVIRSTLLEDGIACRYLLVDDGSTDGTWAKVSAITGKYGNVSALRLTRNFGKELAICAGLDHAEAEKYLIMDSDLQHPPRCVKEMLALMDKAGVNIVNGVKEMRGRERLSYRIFALGFYKLLKQVTGLDMDNSSDFKLVDRSVADALREFRESNLFFRGLIDWVGFSKADYTFTVEQRNEGTSSFSTAKLIKLAVDAIVAHTSKPLYLTFSGGIVFLAIAFVLGVQTLVNFFSGNAVSGFTTVILLLLFTGSIIMLSLGIIGVYMSRIYDEVKRRPRYIVSEYKR